MYLEEQYEQYVLTSRTEYDTVLHTRAVLYPIHDIMLCGCCFCYAIVSPGTSWCALHGCIAQQSNPDCKGLFRWRSCSARLHVSHTEITRSSPESVYQQQQAKNTWFDKEIS